MTEKVASKCRYCGNPLSEPRGMGRPSTYCNRACRRAAQYEVRRASRRIESLEAERDRLERQMAAQDDNPRVLARLQPEHNVAAAQVERARLRLRDLLDTGDDE
jgi:hypothetical protein